MGEGVAAEGPADLFGQRAVGTAAHVNVVIDVDGFVRQAVGKEAADEKGDVTDALQRVISLRHRRRVGSVGHHQRQGAQAVGVAAIFEQLF